MLYHVLIIGAILMGAGAGISIGSLMEHEHVSANMIHWTSRILLLIGCLIGYYACKQLG